MEVYVDDETKLTLHGLQQYYVKLKDNEKNRKLFDLLDLLEFNQVGFCVLNGREFTCAFEVSNFNAVISLTDMLCPDLKQDHSDVLLLHKPESSCVDISGAWIEHWSNIPVKTVETLNCL